jgi:uncharacterized membrane protein
MQEVGAAEDETAAPDAAVPFWRAVARRLPRTLPAIFLLVSVPFGVVFALMVPPSQVPDEPAHFLRVWKLGDGDLIADYRFDAERGINREGGVFDSCVTEYIGEQYAIASTPANFRFRDFFFDTPDCSPQQRAFQFQDAHGDYSAWSYPGQTAGVFIGRVVGLPLPLTFFLGRLAGLAVYLALVWSALRIAPRGGLILFVIGALPLSLTLAAGYTTDGTIIGASLLGIAAVLRAALTAEADARRWTVVALVALGIVVLTKPPYFPLLALVFVVPVTQWPSRRNAWVTRLGGIAAVLVLVAIWRTVAAPPDAGTVFRENIDHNGQIAEILRHPFGFVRLSLETFVSNSSQDFVIQGWVGQFGMLRTGRAQKPLFNSAIVMAVTLLLGAVFATERGARVAARSRRSTIDALVVVAVLVATFFGIYAGLYVIWNPLGSTFIEGVQGRYFLPLLALPALLWGLGRERSITGIGVRAVTCSSVTLLVFAVLKVNHYFY